MDFMYLDVDANQTKKITFPVGHKQGFIWIVAEKSVKYFYIIDGGAKEGYVLPHGSTSFIPMLIKNIECDTEVKVSILNLGQDSSRFDIITSYK